MRPSEVLRRGADYLQGHGVESARAEAETLMMAVLGSDRAGIYSRTEPLSSGQAISYGRALSRRCDGTPIQHLTGRQNFRGLELKTRSGVFIPRQETEVVVERSLEHLGDGDARVLDLGTGTGAIALGIASARPRAEVHAVDTSSEALELASENAADLGLAVTLHGGDMFDALPAGLRGSLDLVVSNPPYVTPEEYADLPVEVLADPADALVGGVEVYERIVAGAAEWLAPGGWLVVEIGAEQGSEVSEVFAGSLREVEVLPDLTGRDRIVEGRL